jgi:hypothetical protein
MSDASSLKVKEELVAFDEYMANLQTWAGVMAGVCREQHNPRV